MTPEEENIFGAFTECQLEPLEGVPTYKYMTNLNVYLNSCSSTVDCTIGCGTLEYLVLTEQPSVFNTHCGTEFSCTDKYGHSSSHAQPNSNGRNFSKLVTTHNHEVRIFNEYHAVDCACKKVIRKFILDK